MRREDLLQSLRTVPFQPFRLFATDGRIYDVRHPDQALVLKSRVILPIPSDDGIMDGLEHLALIHIIRAEVIPQMPAATLN